MRPHRLSLVVEAMHRIDGLTGITVLHAHGSGRSRAPAEGAHSDELGLLAQHDKIEILSSNALAGEIVATIELVIQPRRQFDRASRAVKGTATGGANQESDWRRSRSR
ncbi:MAG: hypothetical protein JRJ58_04360 [Deltaproteobacteria bacterium]|nr:hypothetical protein [Deltaproteobacteria bacterium]